MVTRKSTVAGPRLSVSLRPYLSWLFRCYQNPILVSGPPVTGRAAFWKALRRFVG